MRSAVIILISYDEMCQRLETLHDSASHSFPNSSAWYKTSMGKEFMDFEVTENKIVIDVGSHITTDV